MDPKHTQTPPAQTDAGNATVQTPPEPQAGDADVFATTLEKMSGTLATVATTVGDLNTRLEKAEKVQYPFGAPNGGGRGPAVHTGESANTSRPYSLMRLCVALRKKADHVPNWQENAKVELALSERLQKAYNGIGISNGGCLVPLGADLMPTEDSEMADGTVLPGLPVALVKECRDVMENSLAGFDMDELKWLAQHGRQKLAKDLSANVATAGGTLIAFPSQGELIELLRSMSVMNKVGAQEIDLPPQGSIRFPRITSGITIAAYSEGQTITESTPGTSALLLQAKAYAGLVDIPEELMKFSTSVSVEAWLRTEFALDMNTQTDRDMIYGGGGTAMQGILNFSGLTSVTASTVATDGNTLGPEDPIRLFAAVADANAPVDRGFFYAMTNTLWGGLITRKNSQGAFMFSFASNQIGGGRAANSLNGNPVIGSTNIPTNRVKGAGTNLTLLLGGVGSEWVIGRAGVIDIVVTNSDASKFQQRISTMRGTQYMDAGPRHEESFGVIDSLLNA